MKRKAMGAVPDPWPPEGRQELPSPKTRNHKGANTPKGKPRPHSNHSSPCPWRESKATLEGKRKGEFHPFHSHLQTILAPGEMWARPLSGGYKKRFMPPRSSTGNGRTAGKWASVQQAHTTQSPEEKR